MMQKLRHRTAIDVMPENCDELISIPSLVFVIEPDTVHQLMDTATDQ